MTKKCNKKVKSNEENSKVLRGKKLKSIRNSNMICK